MNPYPEQLEAVRIAVKAGKGGIIMPTGSGKSITMAMLINALQVKTLVVVPNLELKTQLSETFKKIFGSLKNITIENIDSPVLQKKEHYDLLILDECHRSAAKTYRKLNKTQWGGIYHRYFFSATFFRNQPEETLLFESIAGEAIYELTYRKAVANKLVVPIEAYYIEIEKQKTDACTYQQVYSELVVRNDARNLAIANLLFTLNAADKSTLCLVKELAHGQELSDITGYEFSNGQDNKSREFIQQFGRGQIRTLIATTGLMSEGIDCKAAEYVIIGGLGKAKSQLLQQIGRTVRSYPGKESGKVILILDRSHKFTIRHWKEQCKIIKDYYGVVVTKLNV